MNEKKGAQMCALLFIHLQLEFDADKSLERTGKLVYEA